MAGKCELMLLSPVEARMAVRAFRRVLGDENVEVTLRLKDGRDCRRPPGIPLAAGPPVGYSQPYLMATFPF